MNVLLTILSASLDQLLQFPACFLVSGLFMRRSRNVPFDLFDVGSLVVAMLCVGFIVRRMYRSPVRSLAGLGRTSRLPEGTVGPTASWAHFLWDGLWIWFGISLWSVSAAGPVQEFSIGPGFVIVSGLLVLARIFCRIRHRDSPDNI